MDLREGTILESVTLQDNEIESLDSTNCINVPILWPTWLPVRMWEIVVAIAAMFSSTIVIYQAAVDGTSLFGVSLVYILDVIYVLGIISRLFIGYQKRGVIVTDYRKISMRYLTTALIADLISTIPFELPAFFFNGYNGHITSILRLNRIIRYYKPWILCSKH